MVEHAGELDDAAELDLAPVAAHVRRAESGRQLAGLGAKLGLRFEERPDLLVQGGVGAGAGFFDLMQEAVDAGERFANGSDGLRECAAGGFLGLGEGGAGEIEELGTARAQDQPGEGEAGEKTEDRENVLQH